MPNPQHFPPDREPDFVIDVGHNWSREHGTKPHVLVTAPTGEEWLAVYRVVAQDGSPVISELHLVPRPKTTREYDELRKRLKAVEATNVPDGGLPSKAVRALRPGLALEAAQDTLREAYPAELLRAMYDLEPEDLRTLRHRGRRGNADEFYAKVAAAYVEALPRRRPIVELAESLSYTEEYVSDVVRKARKRGLLTAAPRGQAGGELTEKAIAILRETEVDR